MAIFLPQAVKQTPGLALQIKNYKQCITGMPFMALLFLLCFGNIAQAQVVVSFSSAGTANYTVPANITSITVECIGGGGAGGSRTNATAGNGSGGGGGGGAYARSVLTVTPGQVISRTVGAAGASSSFGTGPVLVLAVGGSSVGSNVTTGGAGGLASACTGTDKRDGGAGASGTASGGGGGGGAAGASGVGGTAGVPTAGTGNSPGGNGGDGFNGTGQGNGSAGVSPGGGGGGAKRVSSSARTGGVGSAGLVRITIDCSQPTIQVSGPVTVSPLGNGTATINWSAGNGAGSFVLLKQGSAITDDPAQLTGYTENVAFGSGTLIGASRVVKASAGNSVNITNLQPNTTYYYKIYSMNPTTNCYLVTGALTGSFTTAACHPTTPASGLTSTCPSNNSSTITFTRGSGTHALVVARAGAAVNVDPLYNTSYTANAQFGSGTDLGSSNYVVYNGSDAGTISIPVTGLTAGIAYHFKVYEYNASPNCYNIVSVPTLNFTTRNPGTYSSSTTTQNTGTVQQSKKTQQIIGLSITNTGSTDPATVLNAITFATTGTTNVADISNAKIFYTGTTNVFSAVTQFGSTVATPSGSHTVPGSLALAAGVNYFWITYDISATAVNGNLIDAVVTGFDLTDFGGTSNRTPTITAPTGSRTVGAMPAYCSPRARSDQSQSSCNIDEGINSLNFGAGNFLPGYTCASNSYDNLSATVSTTVAQGQTYNLTLGYTFNYSGDIGWVIWIDLDQSGTFEDNERYPTLLNKYYGETNSVTIPSNALTGATRMRVWAQETWTAPGAGGAGACKTANSNGSTGVGQIIDVTLNITGSGPCATVAPTVTTPISYNQGAAASQLSATGSNLLWYTAATGGTGSATAPTPLTSALGTTVYYVSQTNSCEGPRTQIAVNVNRASVASPTVTTPVNLCTNAVATQLTATGSSLLWYTVSTGGVGSTIAPTPVTTSNGTTPYYVSQTVTCESPRALINAVVATCSTGPSVWTGPTNGSWSNAANWTPAGIPNSCASDVIINSGGTPVISTSHISVKNIIVASGATVTLNGMNLNVCGRFNGDTTNTGNAAVIGSGSTFINGATGAQVIKGDVKFDILQINNSDGVSLNTGANVSVGTGLHLQSGTFNVSGGTLRLLSTASNHNSYIDNFSFGGTPGTLSGQVYIDRYVPVTGYNQHFISSPISGAALSQINASGPDGNYITPTTDCDEYNSDQGSKYGSVFVYNDGYAANGACMLGNWMIKSAGNMTNGLGYSTYLNGNTTLSLYGTANSGNVSVDTKNSGYGDVVTKQARTIQAGWNLVGNPYPSAINLTNDRVGYNNEIQVWQTSGPFAGTWQPRVINPGGVVIPPFQSFMVLKTSAGTGSYQFLQTERSRSTSQPFYRNDAVTSLQLEVDFNGFKDLTTIDFNTNATNNFDGKYDANKYNGSEGRPTLYTHMNTSTWYAINTLSSLTQATTVQVGLRPETTGWMTITPQGIPSFDPTSYIFLEDKKTGNWKNLRDGAYSFEANKADDRNRFVLHFTPAASILTSNASCEATGMINVEQPGSANWNYTLTNNSGITVANGTLNNSRPLHLNAAPGIYSLTLADDKGYTVVKNVEVGGTQSVSANFGSSETTVQTKEEITFTSSSDAMVYNWDFGDGSTATGKVVNHNYITEGVYNVTLSVSNAGGCISATTRTVTITSRSVTGIDNLQNKKISIWSAGNEVYVDFRNQTKVEAEIEVYNVIGQMVSQEKYGKSSLYIRPINVETGYLVVRVKNDSEVITRKVFITNK